MANAILAYNNRADTALYSGGSWLDTLPLTNLNNRIFSRVARSNGLSLANTRFNLDFGVGKLVRTIGLIGTNFSTGAKYRIRGSNDPTFTTSVVDSGWLLAWPNLSNTIDMDWQSDSFWSGRLSDEERGGYTWSNIYTAPYSVAVRYWQIEIDDQTNMMGYIQIARLFIGQSWQFKVNMAYGASIGWETGTEVTEAASGAEYFNRKTPFRVARFTTAFMSTDEAMSNAFDIQRSVGIDKEVIFQYDPADIKHSLRRQFMGRLRQLSPIEHPFPATHSTAFEVKELI